MNKNIESEARAVTGWPHLSKLYAKMYVYINCSELSTYHVPCTQSCCHFRSFKKPLQKCPTTLEVRVHAYHGTCQDKSDETEDRVDEEKDKACEDNVSNERLDTLRWKRLLLCTTSTGQIHLLTTSIIIIIIITIICSSSSRVGFNVPPNTL